MPVLKLGRGADLQVDPRVVEDEREERHEAHGDDVVPYGVDSVLYWVIMRLILSDIRYNDMTRETNG